MGFTVLVKWWSEWGFRVSVIGSLLANIIMVCLSRTRRRSASGWQGRRQLVKVLILWLAYQVADTAATSAIGNLSLCGSDASDEEKQIVAFWAPFLLLLLGGPDNLTAYAQEDNDLSMRKAITMAMHLLGVGYTIYNFIYHYGNHSRALLAASAIMYFAGAARYGEKARALRRANLDNMMKQQQNSTTDDDMEETTKQQKKKKKRKKEKDEAVAYRIRRWLWRPRLNNSEALLLAQDLFPVWRYAMVDSSVDNRLPSQEASKDMIRLLNWRSMCKVVEMELSLMYEVLYTKANLSYEWVVLYYLIRFASPLATATAVYLFWLHREHQGNGGGGGRARGSFVATTYALLGVTLFQDLTWLLRALGSTWTYHNLQAHAPAWLCCHVLHAGRWCSLHRLVVRLDPLWWLFRRDPIRHRIWSGTIGRYNLLHECSTTRFECPGWLAALVPGGDRLKEIRYMSKLPQVVKRLLLKRVQRILLSAIPKDGAGAAAGGGGGEDGGGSSYSYTMLDIRKYWGHKALLCLRDRNKFKPFNPGDKPPQFAEEFEEDVLVWHIATCIFLPRIRSFIRSEGIADEELAHHVQAIEVMSEYLMFLVAVRRQMLPGLVLHSQLEATRKVLGQFWNQNKKKELAKENDKDKLAFILRRFWTSTKEDREKWKMVRDNEGNRVLTDVIDLYGALMRGNMVLGRNKDNTQVPSKEQQRVVTSELLEFVFNVWVDKLVYAAVRCSRESHAKQLSAGGDLTTVLWMLVQHAGPFQVGEMKQPDDDKNKKKPPPVGKMGGEKKPEAKPHEPADGAAPVCQSCPWSPEDIFPGHRWPQERLYMMPEEEPSGFFGAFLDFVGSLFAPPRRRRLQEDGWPPVTMPAPAHPLPGPPPEQWYPPPAAALPTPTPENEQEEAEGYVRLVPRSEDGEDAKEYTMPIEYAMLN